MGIFRDQNVYIIYLLHSIQKAKLSLASDFVKEVHATCGKAKGSFGATKCWQKVPEYGPCQQFYLTSNVFAEVQDAIHSPYVMRA